MSDTAEGAEVKHYGVKGMKWGQRKATIVGARKKGARKATLDAANKEQDYLKTRNAKGVDAPETVAARKTLEAAYVAQAKQILTASTLTRGEQLAVLLVGGPIGAAAIAGNAFSTRESQTVKVRRDVDKMLRNVDPDEED